MRARAAHRSRVYICSRRVFSSLKLGLITGLRNVNHKSCRVRQESRHGNAVIIIKSKWLKNLSLFFAGFESEVGCI